MEGMEKFSYLLMSVCKLPANPLRAGTESYKYKHRYTLGGPFHSDLWEAAWQCCRCKYILLLFWVIC